MSGGMFSGLGGSIVRQARYALVLAGIAVVTGGCATADVSLYRPDAIRATKAWHVDFTYEAGRYEETIGTEAGKESKVTKEGHPPVDLQIRDDMFFRLRDKYGIATVRDDAQADGRIRLHPLHFPGGGFRSLDVLLLDRSDEILGRIRITNGDRNATYKDTTEFGKYCADSVGNVIRREQ